MNLPDTIKALSSLGYRQLGPKMVKSAGYSCLICSFEEGATRIGSYFYGNGSIKDLLCWESKELESDNVVDLLREIVEFEEWSSPGAGTGKYANFCFRTNEEKLQDICNGL